jgi:hypothetical protein
MLTLVKTEDAVPIVGIYRGTKNKTPEHTVYFTHDLDPAKANVAPAAGVLHLHKKQLKKEFHLNDPDFAEICRMIDTGEEPEKGDPLKTEYWNVLERYESFLQREMYIGDDSEARFEINFPRDKQTWPGTMTCIASSGGGKTYFVVQMILRYLRSVPIHQRRPIFWISPELTIDKTLKPIRDNKRYQLWFNGVDISEQNLRKKGMDAASFFQTEIVDRIETLGDGALIIYDDFPDGARSLYPLIERHYNSQLRVARHRNQGIISLIHTYAHGKASSQALQSNKTVIFYPRSQQSRCVQFLRDYLQLSTQNAKDIITRFAALDRWMAIQMHSPVCIYNGKYLILL